MWVAVRAQIWSGGVCVCVCVCVCVSVCACVCASVRAPVQDLKHARCFTGLSCGAVLRPHVILTSFSPLSASISRGSVQQGTACVWLGPACRDTHTLDRANVGTAEPQHGGIVHGNPSQNKNILPGPAFWGSCSMIKIPRLWRFEFIFFKMVMKCLVTWPEKYPTVSKVESMYSYQIVFW